MDEFCKLVHTIKSQGSLSDCRSRSQIDYARQSEIATEFRLKSSIKTIESIWCFLRVSLEMSSDPINYFGFTFDEFTELVYTVKTTQLSTPAGQGSK